MEEKTLQEFGLTRNEAKVYLFLLEEGKANVTEITNNLEIHRVNVYDILKRLLEKGLISYITEGKSKYYSASDPKYFLKILEEKEHLFKKILPNLELKKRLSKRKHEVETYQGIKGIKVIFEDMIKEKKDIHIFGAQGKFSETLPTYLQHFNRQRKINNIKMKVIYSEKLRKFRKKNPIEYVDMKFLTKEYDSPSTTFIYANKVAIIMWALPLLGILIESSRLSKSYMNFFKILWSIAKK